MATRKATSSGTRTASKPVSRPAPSRPTPTRTVRTAVAPHVKTTSNGSPRPKRRSK